MSTTKLYHGSLSSVEHPLVSVGRDDLDFGKGFYVTPLRDQAVSWARTLQGRKKTHVAAILNTYELAWDNAAEAQYRRLRFDSYNEAWLKFIVASRSGEKVWSGYDIIEGGVANDSVIDTVDAYMSGLIDMERALGQLTYHKPNWQVCILSQHIIDQHLRFIGSEEV